MGLDENSSRDMGTLLGVCDIIREFYGCVVILVHHSGHLQGRARGSTAIKGAMDTEIEVSKSGAIITMKSTKAKESEGFAPETFRLMPVDTLWADEDGERIFSAVLELCDPPDEEVVMGKNQTLCLGVLREMYANRQKNLNDAGNGNVSAKVLLSEWREGCGLGKQRFYESKIHLLKLGLIEIQGSTVKVTG